MKIERISENQIRCTLNKEDLEDKEIHLAELAYGTDKAKELFRDMMQQASIELGFEADETPLMIEAIPVNPECLILVITKVSDPEELDTRFSRFTKPFKRDDDDDSEFEDSDDDFSEVDSSDDSAVASFAEGLPTADKILEAIGHYAKGITEALSKKDSKEEAAAPSDEEQKVIKHVAAIFKFKSLEDIMKASKNVADFYTENSNLYKDEAENIYYLVLNKNNLSDILFIKACGIVGEYGESYKGTYATFAHFAEHFKLVRKLDAIQVFANLA